LPFKLFKVCNSLTLFTFTLLCNHHHYLLVALIKERRLRILYFAISDDVTFYFTFLRKKIA
jgi:hypothetical protein